MKDDLGDRMKNNYEDRTRIYLPRRTNLIIRVDGKSFHTYTRDCAKPYDACLMQRMDNTAIALCKGIQGAKFGYVQSDEISIWVTDYDNLETNAWFDNNLQKIVSISSSIATAAFAEQVFKSLDIYTAIELSCPNFDARAFTIPEVGEVANYFLWRSKDAARNAISMVGQATFSQKQLQGKSTTEIVEMVKTERGETYFDHLNLGFRHGRIVLPSTTGWTSIPLPGVSFAVWNDYTQNALKRF